MTGFPTAMTVGQMRALLIYPGVQVGKMKMVAGAIDIDPKMDKHTQLLLPLHGRHFAGMPIPIAGTQVETPAQLTVQEVAEEMVA